MIDENKPPTIRVTLDGIAPRSEEIDPVEPFEGIEWMRIMTLPAFEAFVFDKYCIATPDIQRFMDGQCLDHRLGRLYTEYCGWHRAQGRWPGETPEGRLIE